MREIDAVLVRNLKAMALAPLPPGFKYNVAGYFLKKGHLYSHEPYTEPEATAIVNVIAHTNLTPEAQKCFYNSQKLASLGELRYAEGYVQVDDMFAPVLHAWVVYKGKPVDVTIRRGGDATTKDPVKLLTRAFKNLSRAAYYGVEFPMSAFVPIWYVEGAFRSIVDDSFHGFPLLRRKGKR